MNRFEQERMPFRFTANMARQLSKRLLEMLERSLREFPELKGQTITVGITRSHLGSAVLVGAAAREIKLTIRLNVRNLSYQTIGHELMHLTQGLTRAGRQFSQRPRTGIPGGEKQCDIWTLARSRLFCDEAPTYLRLPRSVRENWLFYARSIRSLCIAAIKKRESDRFYIRWLESEIRTLAKKKSAVPQPHPIQLSLPFA